MRIAIFGGSFDPVHTEHVRLAQAAIEELALDKLFVMPVHAPPHKKGKILTSDEARLEMCRLAFRDEKKVEVSDYEIRQRGTSYTYLTCRYFREQHPSAEIFWIVGADMLQDFPTWRNPESILDDVKLAACGRESLGAWQEGAQKGFFARFHRNFYAFSYNGAAVSSTQIRILAGAGMRLTPFTDEATEAYIQKNGLYRIPDADKALTLEKEERRAHSLRVAYLAAKRAVTLGISETKAIAAALFHDCAKNLTSDSEYLRGCILPTTWGSVPKSVAHQFYGAYLAEQRFGVTDPEVLDAIRYHTSGRPNMCELEKLIFLADMLESERRYDGVETLRSLFWKDLDECLKEALARSIRFVEEKGETVYPLTYRAWEYYTKEN